jgi:cysteinyl-tRNA synthetase
LKVFNTLSREKEEFSPQDNIVRMYVCGITSYDECHFGHAMSYIVFDVIRRYLEFKGYRVKYVQNFTDIDDKIIERANQLGISSGELADKFTASYFAQMDALGVKRADVYPRATEEIAEMVKVIQGLIEKGYAYISGGDVYFRVKKFPGYGKLSHQNPESLLVEARLEPGSGKEDPLDFTLWKAAKPAEPCWGSPWGKGRPGWHIECSVMALKYLGETLDIHGGGQDLIFPHHENEIAQSESYTGITPFARYWLHHGLVQVAEEKMSKSLGNFISLSEALARFDPAAIRLFILSSHYRHPLTYSEKGLASAARGMERLQQAVEAVSQGETAPIDIESFRNKFVEAMDDDFNTPQAIAALFDLTREINRLAGESDVSQAQQSLLELAGVLGLSLKRREARFEAEPLIELLLSIRQQLRENQQWWLADHIRQELNKLGITLEDTPQGTRWRVTPLLLNHNPEVK